MNAESVPHTIDDLDRRLLETMRREPRIGILELSRRLGVARATAQSRMEKLVQAGVITGFGPDLDLAALGYGVTAFCTIEVVQGRITDVVQPLRDIAEVIELHSVAGQGDLFVRIAARSNAHLMDVLERILQIPQVDRTSTAIGLACQIPFRTDQLLAEAIES